VLGDDQVGKPVRLVVGVAVVVLTEDERDQIGILLDRVMDDDVVGDEVVQTVDGDVEGLLDSIGLDRDDRIPIGVAEGEIDQLLAANSRGHSHRPCPPNSGLVEGGAAVLRLDRRLHLAAGHAALRHRRDDEIAPGLFRDQIPIRVAGSVFEMLEDGARVAALVCAEGADDLEEAGEVRTAGHDYVEMGLPPLRVDVLEHSRSNFQSQEQGLHIVRKPGAAGRVVDVRRLARTAKPDTAIGSPEVAQERRYSPCWLGEDGVGNPLLVGAQAEDGEPVHPGSNRIASAVGQVFLRRQVDLKPAALPLDPGLHGIPENLPREICDQLGQLALVARVLDRVPGQSAAIANQVTEQSKFLVAHAGKPSARKIAWNRDRIPFVQFVQPLPTPDRQELVIGGGSDRPTKPGRQPEHGLVAGRECIGGEGGPKLPAIAVHREHFEVALADQLLDRPTDSLAWEIDERIAGQASRLPQVRQHRLRRVALLGGAREL
jgi:hypothetical protein